ncbi:DNA-binding response regulator [Zoogloeaceae bacteirum Par-f-2]|nr:DNA-binding response regulator [Zoogloeaceae bacteirum Par-f-2]
MLLDDHAVVRSGYRRLLDAEPGFEVVAEAATCDEAYACLQRGGVDVAVVDISLRGSSGIEAIRRMLARAPELRILVLSMHDNPGYITQAMRAGAVGYLTKSCEPAEMFDAIRAAAGGRRTLSPEVAQSLATAALDGEHGLSRLTPREFEVLRMAAGGDSAATIARRMHLSQKTVLNHMSTIRQKLEADNDFKLLRLAMCHGLVDLPAAFAYRG